MSFEKVVEAALGRFARQGYDGASLTEIARDAGMRKASLYAHFDGKRQLFLHILGEATKRELGSIERFAPASGLAALREYIFDILNRHGESEYLLFWLRALYAPPAEVAGEIRRTEEKFVRHMDQAIQSAMEGLCPNQDLARIFGEAYTGIIRAVHAELLYLGPEKTGKKAEAMWRVFEMALAGACPEG